MNLKEQRVNGVTWKFDRETGEHFLPINDAQSWKAYKTAAGDYALTLHSEDDGFGGDVEFYNTIEQAKRAAIAKATGAANASR